MLIETQNGVILDGRANTSTQNIRRDTLTSGVHWGKT